MAATPWTPEWLREVYLFGGSLVDDYANDYPESMFTQAMAAAEARISSALDVPVPATLYTDERHDFMAENWSQWFSIVQTYHEPVLASPAPSVRLLFGATPILDVPADWVLQVVNGQIQIVPSAGSVAAYPLQALGFLQSTFTFAGRDVPGLYAVTYKAGWDVRGTAATFSKTAAAAARAWVPSGFYPDGALTITLPAPATQAATFTIKGARRGDGKKLDGVRRESAIRGIAQPETLTIGVGETTATSVNEWSSLSAVTWSVAPVAADNITFTGPAQDRSNVNVPADVLDVMGMMAANSVLEIMGMLLIGAGIASKSVSMDGASQSVNTTSSAENSGYSAQIRSYEKRIKAQMHELRRKYRGVFVGVG